MVTLPCWPPNYIPLLAVTRGHWEKIIDFFFSESRTQFNWFSVQVRKVEPVSNCLFPLPRKCWTCKHAVFQGLSSNVSIKCFLTGCCKWNKGGFGLCGSYDCWQSYALHTRDWGKKQTNQATHPLHGIMRQKAYVSQRFKLRILHQWNNNEGLFAVEICQLRKVMDFQT